MTTSKLHHLAGAEVRVRNLSCHYGEVKAVDDVSFTAKGGEFLTLLGSSGSGKSTTLMMIAGFITPTMGDIAINDRDITVLAPEKRDIGVVFQSYALFPHMTIFENVAFPLRMRRRPAAEIRQRVTAVLEMVELAHRGDDRISALSGGQQQRIALARALVFEPSVLLMDEPMGALDRRLREQMQREVKRIQKDLGITVIYVTHDQEEAMTMSDRIAILSHGRIEQIDPPERIYERPHNPFVAAFLGDSNFFTLGSHGIGPEDASGAPVMVRPEDVRLLSPEEAADHVVTASVTQVEFPGGAMRLTAEGPAGRVEARLHRHAARSLSPGREIRLGWDDRDMVRFNEGSS
ncbi:MAG: ABC transporter ATP-binding protein [Pikeienuella sp.]